MLTLIEPPGSKRAVPTANNRSAQHLLNFAAATDDDDEVDADDAVERGAIERTGTPSLAQASQILVAFSYTAATFECLSCAHRLRFHSCGSCVIDRGIG